MDAGGGGVEGEIQRDVGNQPVGRPIVLAADDVGHGERGGIVCHLRRLEHDPPRLKRIMFLSSFCFSYFPGAGRFRPGSKAFPYVKRSEEHTSELQSLMRIS